MTTTEEPIPGEPLPPPLPENFNDLVGQYVRLRDRIKEADDLHKKKLEKAKSYKDRLEGRMLELLNEQGGNSVSTDSGTVYRTTKNTASIADGDAFREYVIENQFFDLVDWKANAPAVKDHIGAHLAPPPGVNFSSYYSVGIRRA